MRKSAAFSYFFQSARARRLLLWVIADILDRGDDARCGGQECQQSLDEGTFLRCALRRFLLSLIEETDQDVKSNAESISISLRLDGISPVEITLRNNYCTAPKQVRRFYVKSGE